MLKLSFSCQRLFCQHKIVKHNLCLLIATNWPLRVVKTKTYSLLWNNWVRICKLALLVPVPALRSVCIKLVHTGKRRLKRYIFCKTQINAKETVIIFIVVRHLCHFFSAHHLLWFASQQANLVLNRTYPQSHCEIIWPSLGQIWHKSVTWLLWHSSWGGFLHKQRTARDKATALQ